MIDRSVNNFEETHDKLGLNDFDESHDTNDTLDMQAYVSFHFLQCNKRKCSNTWVGRTCASFRSITRLSLHHSFLTWRYPLQRKMIWTNDKVSRGALLKKKKTGLGGFFRSLSVYNRPSFSPIYTQNLGQAPYTACPGSGQQLDT